MATKVGHFKLIDNSKEVLQASKKAKQKALEAIGLQAVGDWQKEIHDKGLVDTGRFENSPAKEVEGNSVYVGTAISDPPYPTFLELGTKKMSAKPTLKPSIEKICPSTKAW